MSGFKVIFNLCWRSKWDFIGIYINWKISFCYRACPIIFNYFTQVLKDQGVIHGCRVFYLFIIENIYLILDIVSKGIRNETIVYVNVIK